MFRMWESEVPGAESDAHLQGNLVTTSGWAVQLLTRLAGDLCVARTKLP